MSVCDTVNLTPHVSRLCEHPVFICIFKFKLHGLKVTSLKLNFGTAKQIQKNCGQIKKSTAKNSKTLFRKKEKKALHLMTISHSGY